MTTARTLTSAGVAQAIRWAFRRGSNSQRMICEGQIMDYLITNAVIEAQDASGIASLEIVAHEDYAHGRLLSNNVHGALRRWKITSLNHLRGWTFDDLLRVDDMTVAGVKEVEALMAKYGLLFDGGDPALLEKNRIEPKPLIDGPDGPPPDGTEEEIRQRTIKALFEIASKLVDDGLSLTKMVAKMATKTGKKGVLKRYVSYRQTAWEDVERVAAPLFTIEDMEKERASKKPIKAPAGEPALRLVGAA